MPQSTRYRLVLGLIVSGGAVGGLLFVSSLLLALYLSATERSGAFLLAFFMSGLPLLAGASAIFLAYSARRHMEHGGSRGTALMAGYAVVFLALVLVVALFAFYGPAS